MPEIICKCFELFSFSLIIIVTKLAGINVKHIDINIKRIESFLLLESFLSIYV